MPDQMHGPNCYCSRCTARYRAEGAKLATVKIGTPGPDAPSVATYFANKLGYALARADGKPTDTLPDTMSITTACGRSCRGAIDAAALLLSHVHAAFGRPGNPKAKQHGDAIARACADVCLCYMYG